MPSQRFIISTSRFATDGIRYIGSSQEIALIGSVYEHLCRYRFPRLEGDRDQLAVLRLDPRQEPIQQNLNANFRKHLQKCPFCHCGSQGQGQVEELFGNSPDRMPGTPIDRRQTAGGQATYKSVVGDQDRPFSHACRLKRRSKTGRRAAVGDEIAFDLLRLSGFALLIIIETVSKRH